MDLPQMEPLYGEAEKRAVSEYLNSGAWLMEHNKTEELEKIMCDITGAKFCSMVPNGTLSLCAALKAMGVKPGDRVAVPDYTIIATATAASFIGAKPLFVDIEPKTFAIDFKHLKQRITKSTKAIVLVSINGRPPRDWVEILDFAQEKDIPVLEDAAQTLGSYYNIEESKIHLGRLGTAGSFSFSMSKIVTMGAGGAVITDDEDLYNEIELMKDFGRIKGGRDVNIYPGIDLKYNDLQAVIGIEALKRIDWRVNRKKEIYKMYRDSLKDIVKFVDTDLKYTAPWMHDIILRNEREREYLSKYLNEKGIGTRNFYPAIHSQKPFYCSDTRFHISSEISKKGLWLPSSLKLTNGQIKYVCEHVRKALE